MKKVSLIAIASIIAISVSAQTSTGGEQKIYLDSNYAMVADQSVASYYSIVNYDNGKIKNPCTDYFLSGAKHWEGNLLTVDKATGAYVMDGNCTYYDNAGKKLFQIGMSANTWNGDYIAWWPNGKVKEKSTYESNIKTGCEFKWDESGNCISGDLYYSEDQFKKDPERFNVKCDCKTGTAVKIVSKMVTILKAGATIGGVFEDNEELDNANVFELKYTESGEPAYVILTAKFKSDEYTKNLYNACVSSVLLRANRMTKDDMLRNSNKVISYQIDLANPDMTSKFDDGTDLKNVLLSSLTKSEPQTGNRGTIKMKLKIININDGKTVAEKEISTKTDLFPAEVDYSTAFFGVAFKMRNVVRDGFKVYSNVKEVVDEKGNGDAKRISINCGTNINVKRGNTFVVNCGNEKIGYVKVVDVENDFCVCKVQDGGEAIGKLVKEKKKLSVISDNFDF